jgi:ribosomal protein S15P/S13E
MTLDNNDHSCSENESNIVKRIKRLIEYFRRDVQWGIGTSS